jgi:hypothetical protein
MRKIISAAALSAAILTMSACKTADSAASGVKSAGSAVASCVSNVGTAATSLVNVNLSNVLNDLAVQLHVDRANIPVNAQIPITIAANICGVSINVLSVSQGGTSKGCTAVTTSPQLTQVVGQQLQAGSGTQTGTVPSTTTPQPATTTAQPQPQPPTTPPR